MKAAPRWRVRASPCTDTGGANLSRPQLANSTADVVA